MNPHEFTADAPPTPVKTPRVDIFLPSSDNEDEEHLTAAEQLPWRSNSVEEVSEDGIDNPEHDPNDTLLINGEANDGDRETRF